MTRLPPGKAPRAHAGTARAARRPARAYLTRVVWLVCLARLAAVGCMAGAGGWASAAQPGEPKVEPAAPPQVDGEPCDAECLNQRAAAGWARSSGEAAPLVQHTPDGQVRLQWSGSLVIRAHHNQINAGLPGAVNTPALPGSAGLMSLQTELRLPELDGEATSVQLAAQGGDDRQALPRHGTQLQNLSWARQGPASALQLGDHAANFSQLGLQLGYRGVFLQREVQGMQLALLGGTVAESWESLFNRAPRGGGPARNQYLRDIAAIQLGRSFEAGLRLSAAVGAWRDRVASLNEAQRSTGGVQGRSLMLSAQYQHEALTLAMELAHSRTRMRPLPAAWPETLDAEAQALAPSAPSATQEQRSDAGSFDAGYRFSAGQLRLGVRRLGMRYGSAAATAPAGTEEIYLAGDAQAAAWLQLNADLRRTTQRTPASEFGGASRNVGDRLQIGATFSLAAWLEGLSSTWQGSLTDQHGTAGQRNRQAQASAALQWQARLATLSLQASDNRSRTPGYAVADSDSRGLQAQVALPFGAEALAQGLPVWSGQASLGLSNQEQTMLALAAVSRAQGVNLGLQAQRSGIGQFNLALQEQANRAPQGGQRLRQRQLQADWQRSLTAASEARLSLRWAWRNLGDPALLARERSVSVELQTRW